MITKIAKVGLAAICSSGCATAMAADWNLTGFVRQEIAYKTTNDYNMNNQQTNSYNGVAIPSVGLFGPTATRPAALTDQNDYNQFSTRIELNLDGKLSENLSAHVKFRGINDEIGQVEKSFKGVNNYQQEFYGGTRGNQLESTGKNWMMDLPIAYLDYNDGPLWLRVGNQQIAWGEALFFRVSDAPNGLDLRRHSVLGVAAEEYSDSRVPALGIRGSYRLNESWDVEGFGQQFQPSILSGPNSPYNVIASQFTVHEKEGFDKVKNDWNFGLRFRGKIGDYGVQAFAVSRNNPDGVYKWTAATGAGAIPGTAFQAGTGTGVYSSTEWMDYAAHMRLDGIGGVMTSLNEFPIGALAVSAVGAFVPGFSLAGLCGASSGNTNPITLNGASAKCLLDTFFATAGFGNLRGHIVREYKHENILGFGVNHVFEGEPDSLLDQLIGRFEMSYTPNKKFTNPTLSQNYLERDETQFAFIFEKYHKFSSEIPATYVVAQWLHKSASDLFGRALEGLNNEPGSVPKGQSSFNAVALAIQQPSPTLAWRFDMTALTDLKGGWLLQPGAKWKPNRDFQLDIYANVLKSYGKQDNRNFAQGLEYANELFVRGTYSF